MTRMLLVAIASGIAWCSLACEPAFAADQRLPVARAAKRLPAPVLIEPHRGVVWDGPAVYRTWTWGGPRIVAVRGLGYRYYRGWCFDHPDECAPSSWSWWW